MYLKLALAISLSMQISSVAASEVLDQQCSTVSDCAQKAMEAAYQAKLALQLAVPKGAVMAFNLEECPKGWSSFDNLNGRVVVGSGTGSSGLTDRTLGEQGGEEKHILLQSELTPHSHVYTFTDHTHTPQHVDDSEEEFGKSNTPADTTITGDGAPFNVMQPFHVLKYCERK